MDRNAFYSGNMAMWFGLVYIFSMCFVVGRGHAVFVQNARLKDTLCPEYTFNGHRSSIVRCGRLCASNATCRAFFFDITSSDCYVIDTAVAVTNACVFKPGHLYEVAASNLSTTTSTPETSSASTSLTTAAQLTTILSQTPATETTVTSAPATETAITTTTVTETATTAAATYADITTTTTTATITTAATTTTTTTAATSTTTTGPMIFQTPCLSNANCLSTPNMSCIDLMCQCVAPTKYNSASSSCVSSCGSSGFGTTYTRMRNTEFSGTPIGFIVTVASVSECESLCSGRTLCAGVQFWAAIYCMMKEQSTSFASSNGLDWHMRNCV